MTDRFSLILFLLSGLAGFSLLACNGIAETELIDGISDAGSPSDRATFFPLGVRINRPPTALIPASAYLAFLLRSPPGD